MAVRDWGPAEGNRSSGAQATRCGGPSCPWKLGPNHRQPNPPPLEAGRARSTWRGTNCEEGPSPLLMRFTHSWSPMSEMD